ncbi:hypothetical protein DF049_26875 [Burkholderia cenocepacia]|nr:hypothetical protein DF049_26875 [Burkholderia cenocepacia]
MCSVRFRCRAIAGAAGNDAASLGFGGQTKHPRGWQSPFPAAQHCALRRAGRDGFPVERASRTPSAGQRAAAGSHRLARIGLLPLVQARRAS